MHLRRALLLFAIVLVVAALAASLSPQRDRKAAEEPARGPTEAAQPSPRRAADVEPARFSTRGKPERRTVDVRRQARVSVATTRSGQVELAGLGRTAAAEPATPATFDLFPTEIGRYGVLFETAAKGERRRVGTLVVEQGSLLP